MMVNIYIYTYGWWCNNHLETYEFVNGKDDIPYIMENKTCLKPPTSLYAPSFSQTWQHIL